MRARHIPLLLIIIGSLGPAGCAGQSTASPTSPVAASTFTMTWNSLSFPNTTVSTTSAATVVATLWNLGSADVTVAGVTDSNAVEFPWSTTCSLAGSLAPGSTCSVTAGFRPAATGVKTASLVITANGTAQTLSMTGTGTQAVNLQLAIVPSRGAPSTPFALALTGATPSGQVALHTTYSPAPGNPDISFATTSWTADASGTLTVTSSHDSSGTFENWFVDVATGLSSNHVVSVVD